MRVYLSIILLGVLACGCGPRNLDVPKQVLLEEQAPVLVSTNRELERPSFPLKCEAVGTDGPGGAFMPIMLLSSPFPRGGGEGRDTTLGSHTVKIYRGTNQIAASNHFLGEFEVFGPQTADEKSHVYIWFNLNAQKQLSLYASDYQGLKPYEVRAMTNR